MAPPRPPPCGGTFGDNSPSGPYSQKPLLSPQTLDLDGHCDEFKSDVEVGASLPLGGGTNLTQTVANLSKVCIGTGVLALPYSFAQGGVLFSAVGLYIIAQWNIYSINRLLLCEKIVKQLPTTGPCRNLSTFSLVALKALGEFGTSLVDYTIVSLMIGVCIAYQVAASGFLTSDPVLSFGSSHVNTLSTMLVVLPFSLAPNVGFLSKFSMMGLGAIALSFLAIFNHGYNEYGLSGFTHFPTSSLFPSSFTEFSHWFGVSSFCFGVSPIIFNVKESMAKPSEMQRACKVALNLVCFAYILFGDLTLLLLTPPGAMPITGDIIQSLPPNSLPTLVVRISMVFVCLVSYPLCAVPAAEILEGKMFPGRSELMPPTLPQRFLSRGGVVLLSTTVATWIPSFVLVVSLIGCFSVGLVAFIFPPLFHLRLMKKLRAMILDGGNLESSSLLQSGKASSIIEVQGGVKEIWKDRTMLVMGVLATIFTTAQTLLTMGDTKK